MKISERWLREWFQTGIGSDAIAAQLTAGGIEVAGMTALEPRWSRVVVGEIVAIAPHPEADRLRVCQVDVAADAPLAIVCGAANAAAGLRVPVALAGARLPGGQMIAETAVRGVHSQGMLCSAAELGLEAESSGLLVLGPDAAPGVPVEEVLGLPDRVFEIELTPNRGDCLSILGIARELAFLTGVPYSVHRAAPVRARDRRRIPVTVSAPESCPRYLGRPVYGLDTRAQTPTWMRERLRRSGIRSIHPVVDVTNYVMLERGQPMHGFALARIEGGIEVRHAHNGESITLLDGQSVTIAAGTLLIADARGPLAIAGVMGGADSAISTATADVFLESAFFRPQSVAISARRLGLHTDASHRFERGVDPVLSREALERATQLLIEIAGGVPGPVTEASDRSHWPRHSPIPLKGARLNQILGWSLPAREVERLLRRIGGALKVTAGGWRLTPPSWRFDLHEECDLIEEVARGRGYEEVPVRMPRATLQTAAPSSLRLAEDRVRALLVDRDYQEAITYSFVDPVLEALFDPDGAGPVLANPIASNLAVMRTSLAPGLIQALLHNRRRQQQRVRLFETGLCFRRQGDTILQQPRLGLAAVGEAWPRQWAATGRLVDFYDLKGDLEALFLLSGRTGVLRLRAAGIPGLHPGQSAEILVDQEVVGWLGALHPDLQARFEIDDRIVLLDIDLAPVLVKRHEHFKEISRFPSIRRDLALLVARDLPADAITEEIRRAAGELLVHLEIFDEYRGEGIDSGRKSIAATLTLQDSSRTLTEDTVEAVMARVVATLAQTCGAELR